MGIMTMGMMGMMGMRVTEGAAAAMYRGKTVLFQ